MADEHVYGFNKPDAEAILNGLGDRPPGPPAPPGLGPGRWICKTPSGGIAARSGSSVTSANCDVYYISSGVLTSSGITVPVYNLSTTAIAELVYIVPVFAGGALVAVWEDC